MGFIAYSAPWNAFQRDAIIGPDGNLWVVGASNIVYKFDTTAFTTTAYTITNALQLLNLCTDGTYVYAIDAQASNATGRTLIWQLTTSGSVSVFFTANSFENGGNLYFDGTDIWATTRFRMLQIDLTGTLVQGFTGPANYGGGLINDGTYWFSGAYFSPADGVSRAPVGTPGTWTDFSTGLVNTGPTFPTVEAAGVVWVGNASTDIFGMNPSSGAFTDYPVSVGLAQCLQLAYDGTSLWAALGGVGQIWQTTTADPSVGVNYTSPATPASTILYDASTKTIWATGVTGTNAGRVYSLTGGGMRYAMTP